MKDIIIWWQKMDYNLCELKKESKFDKIFFRCCTGVAFAFLCVILSLTFTKSMWYDEVFSLFLIKGSFLDIITGTALDVHPPLYYFILKIAVDFLTGIFPFLTDVFVAKFVSFSAIAILFYFIIFRFSKILDKKIVGIFAVSIFAIPVISDFFLTIRMYSFSLLFLVLGVYYLIRIIKFDGNKDWKGLVISFELAALTHYYALLCMVGIFLYLLVYILCNRKQDFWKFYKYALIAFLVYVPWLSVFCVQFAYILGVGYWISGTNAFNPKQIFGYAFSPLGVGADISKSFVIAIILYALYLLVFVFNFINKKISRQEKWISFSGFFVASFLIVSAFSVSYIISPLMIQRYTIPFLAVLCFSLVYNFYLFIKYYICEFLRKFIKLKNIDNIAICLILFFAIIFSTVNIIDFVKKEKDWNDEVLKCEKILKSYEEAVFLSDYGGMQCTIEYIFNTEINDLYDTDVSWWPLVVKADHEEYSIEQIKNILMQNSETNIILFNTKIDIKILDDYGIKYKLIEHLEMEANEITDVYLLYC